MKKKHVTHIKKIEYTPSDGFRFIKRSMHEFLKTQSRVSIDDITYTEMSKTVTVNSQNSVSYFIVASREDAELYRKQYIKYLITIYSDAIDRLTKSIQ